jgi:hypothetical protein
MKSSMVFAGWMGLQTGLSEDNLADGVLSRRHSGSM